VDFTNVHNWVTGVVVPEQKWDRDGLPKVNIGPKVLTAEAWGRICPEWMVRIYKYGFFCLYRAA